MKLGKKEKQILAFLECPASEELLLTQFAPHRLSSRTHWDAPEYHKVRMILSRMIAKGLITKKGNEYEKILYKSTPNA